MSERQPLESTQKDKTVVAGSIPPLDEHGLLPQGTHDCTLEDIVEKFCWNEHRKKLFNGLCGFLENEWKPRGIRCPVYIDGSFTRSKNLPNDIDVVIDMSDFDSGKAAVVAFEMHLNHDRIKETYSTDAWVYHPSFPWDIVAFFQYTGDKAAAELCIADKKRPKGILRIRL